MSLAMSIEEREAFLARAHVGVVSVADDDGRGPLTVPMWYGYEPGGTVTLLTPRGSRKTRLIRRAGRLSLCVQTAEAPYKYVTVEGPVTAIEESVTLEERRALAHRYLGPEPGDFYVESTADATDSMVRIRMRPERWLSVDQGKA
jgi:PPOX class probable F420-dependent enzyme